MRSIYTILPIIIVSVLCFANNNYISIALVPITLCGVLSLGQIGRSLKSSDFATNAYFYSWIFIFISTFLSPLIHIGRDYWMPYMTPKPRDWTLYSFVVSLMYLVGIVIWTRIFKNSSPVNQKKDLWVLNNHWQIWLFVFMAISVVAQLYVYSKMGGILGYIHAFSVKGDDVNDFAGMGLFFILSESFPYTLLIYIIFKFKGKRVGLLGFYLMLIALFLVTMFFGGLRGSRSNTALFMVISIIAINLFVYHVKKKDVILLLLGFFLFMYVGRMYKDYGENLFEEKTTMVQANSNLTSIETTITGDLARYDVNAYEIFLLENVRQGYEYKYGETYLWGILTFVPGGRYIIKAFNLEGKASAASELFFGSSEYKNSRILGPIGEWFVNFGLYSFFIIYFFTGYVIRHIRRYVQSLSLNDVRYMIVPSLMVFLPQIILSDFSNITFFFVKRIVVVLIILYFISSKKTIKI